MKTFNCGVFASFSLLLAVIAYQPENALAQSYPNMPADASGPQVPDGVAQFAVDPFWPKPLPNNWIIGQMAGTAVDSDDNVWIIHRPWTVQSTNAGSTPLQTTRDRTWGHDPLQSLCCTTAPAVLAFDPDGNVIYAWGGDMPVSMV